MLEFLKSWKVCIEAVGVYLSVIAFSTTIGPAQSWLQANLEVTRQLFFASAICFVISVFGLYSSYWRISDGGEGIKSQDYPKANSLAENCQEFIAWLMAMVMAFCILIIFDMGYQLIVHNYDKVHISALGAGMIISFVMILLGVHILKRWINEDLDNDGEDKDYPAIPSPPTPTGGKMINPDLNTWFDNYFNNPRAQLAKEKRVGRKISTWFNNPWY